MYSMTSLVRTLVGVLATTASVSAHTKLDEPASAIRRPQTSDGTCQTRWGPALQGSPCCSQRSNGNPGATRYTRGQSVPLQWVRANHPGGFIALSIVPFDRSDEGFDLYNQNIIQFNCNEQTCMSGESCRDLTGTGPCDAPFGGDNAVRPNQCKQTFNVPTWLPDGRYTLGWRWYGSGGWYGDITRSQGDFFTCADFTISGGPPQTQKPGEFCPVMKLGDIHDGTPNQCTHIGEGNKFNWCPEQACKGDYRKSAPAGFENCIGRSQAPPPPGNVTVPTTPVTPPPSTAPPPPPAPSNAGSPSPSSPPSPPSNPSPSGSPSAKAKCKRKKVIQ